MAASPNGSDNSLSHSEVQQFFEELLAGRFNDQSEYVRYQLSADGYILWYRTIRDVCEGIENRAVSFGREDLFRHVIVAAFTLNRYDVISYFLNEDKSRFNASLFSATEDYVCTPSLFNFLLSEGVIFDFEELVLHCCCFGDISLLKEIQKYHKITDSDPNGTRYMEDAIGELQCPMIEYLVNELGFDINKRNLFGGSYLHKAVERRGNIDVCICLLDLGIDKNIKDNVGRTASECAFEYDGGAPDVEVRTLIDEYEPLPYVKDPGYD